MSKKSVIILGSVVVVCGLFSSLFVDWPVDFSDAGGDIAKASRFSREQASEKLTNMEELLQTDSAFKDGIVAAQVIMQTRAVQFGSLVDMSNEVAGEIPAFAEVLKEMNATRKMVDNVTQSLTESAKNLNAALGGEECANLEQTTINASLAYTTLQKQNKLATRFIETTDKYLETAQADDHLKFVRDQWVDYQKMTAALDGDKAAAEALAKKGNLLSGEKTLAAMADFGIANQVAMVNSAFMTKNTGVDGSLANALPEGALENVFTRIRNAAEVYGNQANAMNNQANAMNNQANAMNNQAGVAKFNQQVIDALNQAIIVASQQSMVSQQAKVGQQAKIGQQAKVGQQATVGQQAKVSQQATVNQQATLAMKKGGGPVVFNQTVDMMASTNVMRAYQSVMSNAIIVKQTQAGGLCNQVNEVIKSTCAGNRATLDLRAPR